MALALVLVATIAWVFAQRDAYNASERDLPIELLSADGPKITLYRQPLNSWVEPGTETLLATAPALGAFPPGLVDDNWHLATRVREFDPSNLYEKINGEAEKFIKQGFRALHYAALTGKDGSQLALELYDQGNLGGSLGIFAAHRPANKAIQE